MLVELSDTQTTEQDNRDAVKEADNFLNKRDGQWEDSVVSSWSNRPKYTFDQCNPVLDSIMSDMEAVDFAVKAIPAGGDSTIDMAKNYAGLIRNIENISSARYIYGSSARVMVGTGLSGWRIKTDFRDSDSFQQDLMIAPIDNFKERVWFDQGAVKQTMEDADHCWLLTALSKKDYDFSFKKGSGLSVDEDRRYESYENKKEEVVIGEYLYKKYSKRKLVLMSNGAVYVVDDKFEQIREELYESGIQVVRERERDLATVYQRLFDGGNWLSKPQKTVFEYLPVIPCFANFGLSENKLVYWGAIEKLMDAQRVLNYAESKKIAESALKPIEKVYVTSDQIKTPEVRATMQTQNTNNDPIQVYDYVEGQPAPYRPQASQPDMILIETAKSSKEYINMAANLFDANRGQGLSGQSGETVRLLQNKGESSNYKYFNSMEIALTHSGKVLQRAIPKVYDTTQQLRILGEDGAHSMITILDKVKDKETGDIVEVNDLSKGSYDITYSSGPAYHNRQQETVTTFLEMAAVDPTILQMGQDILLNNIPTPGMSKLAERVRNKMLLSGLIPDDQMTEDEVQAAKQRLANPPKPSPTEQAQLGLAKAEIQKAQAQTQDTLSKMEERQTKADLAGKQMMIDYQMKQQELEDARTEKIIKMIMAQSDQLNTHADTLKKLKEALGADQIVSMGGVEAYKNQTEVVQATQHEQKPLP